MKRNIYGVGVDAGMIIVADKGYFNGADIPSHLAQTLKVPIGTYQVSWAIPNTWRGPQSGIKGLYVPSGVIVISDPCYIIRDDQWGEWLENTDYGKNLATNIAFILDSMGGDGSYDIHLNLIRLCNRKGKSL